jgi:mannose-6-phosphate isomerase-like protein (cupin superfamily)
LAESETAPLILENRHTGERLALRAVMQQGELCLEIKGTVPAYGEGPPLHIHLAEDEVATVVSGTVSAILNGQPLRAKTGESVRFPRGSAHRWWNGDGETLRLDGYARPLVDLDRYVQAVFEVANASPKGRPDPFYMAHVALRHRRTQEVLLMPGPIQAILFRVLVLVGTVLGRYRGEDWPGCPSRCQGVKR